MSFAGLLGAGLLGGVSNAAKGIGDRLREEAKQKRQQALQQQIKEDNAAQQVINQKDALLVADRNSENNIKELKAQGLVTIGVNDAGADNQSDLLAQKGHQDQAKLILNASLTQDTTAFTQAGAAAIKESELRLTALLKDGNNTTLAELQAEETNLKALIAKETAATKVVTDAKVVETAVTANAVVADQAKTDTLEIQAAGGLITTEQKREGYAARLVEINAAKVGDIKEFYDEDSGMIQPHERMADMSWKPIGGTKAPTASTSKGLTLQNGYNDNGEEVKGYMNGTSFVQVGAAKAVKATTEKEARDYLTDMSKFLISGASNSFMATPLSDEDASLVASWVDEGMTLWSSSGSPKNLSSIVKNVMIKPWKLKDSDITSQDIDQAKTQKDNSGNSALSVREYSIQIATRRQPDFIKAQEKYDAFVANNKDPAPVIKMMKKMGYDPSLLIKPKKATK
jgi:hypothetical protein